MFNSLLAIFQRNFHFQFSQILGTTNGWRKLWCCWCFLHGILLFLRRHYFFAIKFTNMFNVFCNRILTIFSTKNQWVQMCFFFIQQHRLSACTNTIQQQQKTLWNTYTLHHHLKISSHQRMCVKCSFWHKVRKVRKRNPPSPIPMVCIPVTRTRPMATMMIRPTVTHTIGEARDRSLYIYKNCPAWQMKTTPQIDMKNQIYVHALHRTCAVPVITPISTWMNWSQPRPNLSKCKVPHLLPQQLNSKGRQMKTLATEIITKCFGHWPL